MAPESRLERNLYRWCALGMLASTALLLVWVQRSAGAAGLWKLSGSAAASLFVIGKFVIFTGLHDDALSVWMLALMVFELDMVFAFAMASGLEGLERAPVLGRWLRHARARALELLDRYPGFQRLAFFGVVAFVLLPLAGTGSITGSFVARILGLSRLAGIGAIALASAWSACAFALLAHFLGEQAETLLQSPLVAGFSLCLAALLGWLAYRRILAHLRT